MSEQEQAFIGWDRGVDFNNAKATLEQLIAETHNRVDRAFYCILLITHVNGCRRQEGINAAMQYAENGKKEQRVRVQKRKDKYMRLMIIPDIVRKYKNVPDGLRQIVDEHDDVPSAVYYWCKSRLGHNVHSMRYSFISDMSHDKPAQLIAKVTGQKKVETVMRYIMQKEAETALRARFGQN